MEDTPWYERVPIPALMREASRGSYGDASRRALAAVGCDDLPTNGGFVIAGLDATVPDPEPTPVADAVAPLRLSDEAASRLIDTLCAPRGPLQARSRSRGAEARNAAADRPRPHRRRRDPNGSRRGRRRPRATPHPDRASRAARRTRRTRADTRAACSLDDRRQRAHALASSGDAWGARWRSGSGRALERRGRRVSEMTRSEALPSAGALEEVRRLAGSSAVILDVARLEGGQHADTWRVDTDNPAFSVVVRQFPIADSAACHEQRVLRALDGLGGLAPVLLGGDLDGQWSEHPTSLISWLDGEPDITPSDPESVGARAGSRAGSGARGARRPAGGPAERVRRQRISG